MEVLSPKVLLVSQDPRLAGELRDAFASIANVRPVIASAADFRQGVEAVRSRRPDLVLVELDADVQRLGTFVEEAAIASPESHVVAVFHPNVFHHGEGTESEFLLAGVRAGVRDFLRRPLSSADVSRLFERLGRSAPSRAQRAGKVVAFMANKGGVGKSTLSTNVAVGLALRHPGRVLLIDGSLQMGVCSPMLDLEPATTITDAVRQRDRLDERLLRELAVPHKSGLHLLACPNDALEAAEVDEHVVTRILTLARRTYDYVVIDTFPMVDPVMMAVLDLAETVYVVTESTVPVIRGAVKLIELLDQLAVPKSRRKLILNRYSSFAGNLRPADVAERLGQPVDHLIPYEKKLLVAANLGVPFMMNAGRFSSFARAMRAMIGEIERRPASSVDVEAIDAEVQA